MSKRPESLVRSVEGLNLLSLDQFADRQREIPLKDRLMGSLALAGCESWDEEGRLIKGPAVSLVGIGGIPLDIPSLSDEEALERAREMADYTRSTMELSAGMSYLNSGNLERGALYGKVVGELGHLSVSHTTSVNVLVAGTTLAVQPEFDSQKDLVHGSRLTTARTSIQSRPPLVVADSGNVEAVRQAMVAIDTITEGLAPSWPLDSREKRMDFQEFKNNLYPAAKADIIMLSGTLRNFGKLTAQSDDLGKEREYRMVLKDLHSQLAVLWPEIFKENE